MCYWSELAHDIVLPPSGMTTNLVTLVTLVRAVHTAPTYVSDELISTP